MKVKHIVTSILSAGLLILMFSSCASSGTSAGSGTTAPAVVKNVSLVETMEQENGS